MSCSTVVRTVPARVTTRKRPSRRLRPSPSTPYAPTLPSSPPRWPRPTLMPELPEVEVVRRGLAAAITGRTISTVEVLHPRPVRRHLAGPDDFATTLTGRTFAAPRRRGKYLWLPLTDG